jgi:hypothetical protein
VGCRSHQTAESTNLFELLIVDDLSQLRLRETLTLGRNALVERAAVEYMLDLVDVLDVLFDLHGYGISVSTCTAVQLYLGTGASNSNQERG